MECPVTGNPQLFKLKKPNVTTAGQKCAVCMDPMYQEESIINLGHGGDHTFHKDCLKVS